MVLDGALATELEKRGLDLNSSLWSASIISGSPESIRDVHLDYLNCGADIITTASYQASMKGLCEFGYERDEARSIIRRSVEIAREALEIYNEMTMNEERPRLIAGSAGPFGAYLADGSEYSGSYSMENSDYAGFHRERIEILCEEGVDLLAFETFPRIDEAFSVYEMMMKDFPLMPFWISFTTPDGEKTGAGHVLSEFVSAVEISENFLGPGINCSHPCHVEKFLKTLSVTYDGKYIVYPNSGEGFDIENRNWTGTGDLKVFEDSILKWYRMGAHIIGGCCRTGPDTISLISRIRRGLE